jgi:hypothetical protein
MTNTHNMKAMDMACVFERPADESGVCMSCHKLWKVGSLLSRVVSGLLQQRAVINLGICPVEA